MQFDRTLVWFRRDLRLDDNCALASALVRSRSIACLFVFDTDILDRLVDRADRSVEFIHESVCELASRIDALGGQLMIAHGSACDQVPRIARMIGAQAVFANRDYEPDALRRDRQVDERLRENGARLALTRDTVVFEGDEILNGNGAPYSVFTPYRKAWLHRLESDRWQSHNEEADLRGRFLVIDAKIAEHLRTPPLERLGFERTGLNSIGVRAGQAEASRLFEAFGDRIGQYQETRDYPAVKGPSYLSAHLRFGTISIRRLVRFAVQTSTTQPALAAGAQTWLSELVWRDFYFQVLHHHPHVVERNFRREFDRVRWNDDESALTAWQEGRTGYPIVDAAMNQLNRTGYMHNRLRMIVASFLTKDLGIDWRRGEAYFARKLLDFDLAANNGGWQWAASTGCDSQPWFRIFNPVTQSKRFDPRGRFIRRYLPALERLDDREIHAPWLVDTARLQAAGVRIGTDYPGPMVDHAEARLRTLERFSAVRAATQGQ